MKLLIRRAIRKLIGLAFEPLIGQISSSQETQILLAQQYKDLLRRNVNPLPTFDEVGFRCLSEYEEDGILLYIFSLIGTTNKVCVDIGAGNGIVGNVTNLILNHGWHGYLFDGNSKNVENGKHFFSQHKDTKLWPPRFANTWITAENINAIVRSEGVGGHIDLLSLDIDGMDYWIWKALDCIQPRVVVCEAHNIIGSEISVTVPYSADFKIEIPDYCGASLTAMAKLGAKKGYRLVGTNRIGLNAFFIRNDIGEDIFPSVPVEVCLNHPYAKQAIKGRWAKVKDLDWVEI